MTVALGLGALAFALTFVALLIVSTLLVIAAPWEGGRAPLRDHWRIGRAVVAVDFWLELRGVCGKRRRDLRGELRGNLYEAACTGGSTQAVAGLGSLRELAAGYAEQPPTAATSWSRGVSWFSIVSLVIVGLSLVTTTTWVQASMASQAVRAAGRPLFSPWLQVVVENGAADGVTLGAALDWWVILIPAVAFVVGARVWRRAARTEAVA